MHNGALMHQYILHGLKDIHGKRFSSTKVLSIFYVINFQEDLVLVKGPRCARIVDKFGLTHLSAGELLRQEATQNSERAALIAEYIKDGKIVPQVENIIYVTNIPTVHPQSKAIRFSRK